ncbi:MAG: pyridoxamine 5'-phosphate oxidase [Pseudomonadota bacterium]
MTEEAIIPETPSDEFYSADEDQGHVFTDDDPFVLFREWLLLANDREINDPNAMSLATVDASGLPDVRIVLMKDLNDRGVSFFTNMTSAKGRQIDANNWGALSFHWKSIRRQVRFRGEIEQVTASEADAYFAKRARGTQIGAWASDQSNVLSSPDALQRSVDECERRFEGKPVPRPGHWTGYRLIPTEIEFWVNRPYRLHHRKKFVRTNNNWEAQWLSP